VSRWKVALGVLGALFVVAVVAVAVLLNSVVSGGQKDRLTALAGEKLGARVDLESYGLDFWSILRLRPAVVLNGLRVANPPGYPQRNLLEAREVLANLDLRAALSKKIEVQSLLIRDPRIVIEVPADGPTNLEFLLEHLNGKTSPPRAAGAPEPPGEDLKIGVASVEIVNGTVAIASAGADPEAALNQVNIRVSDIRPGSPSTLDLAAQLGESAYSTIRITGAAGPLGAKALPLKGQAAVQLALAEFSPALRQRFLGELAAAPGPDSRVKLDLALAGDLYRTLDGKGAMDIAQFLIGPNQGNRLALAGKAPLALRVEDALSGGPAELVSQGATLQLGAGQWTGNLKAARRGETLSGSVDGNIRNVDINQMLTSFAKSPDVMYGTATIPRFQIAFSGRNAADLQRSLNGNGSLNVANGRFKGLNVLATIERALGGQPTGAGEFATFATDFGIRNRTLQLTGINVSGPGIHVTGQGTIGFDESLNFTLQSTLTGASADLLKARTGGIVSNVAIPVTIAGTVSAPQVRPNLSGLAKNAATEAIGNVLGGFLGGRKKK
jgi:uncharacterized protein involved in outer membrane biogenesis